MDKQNTQDTRDAQDPQDPNSETYDYLQEDFNEGQAQVNFLLNEVDKDFIRAIREILHTLKTVQALPQLSHALTQIDFNAIDKALSRAEERSEMVADIRPPGCTPYPA